MSNLNPILVVTKGLIVGGTMLVPGVSGGSMAMILGIYHRLISSVSSFSKHKKASLLFLTLFVAGAGIGMLLFAKPLLTLIERYPKPMLYFFLGAVGGGIPLIYRESQVHELSWRLAGFVMLGWLIVVAFEMLPADIALTGTTGGSLQPLILLGIGIIAATALVLPGISVSYLFLILGLYEDLIKAISTLQIGFLFPLALGMIAGILLVTRVLEQAMTKRPNETYLLILGFVIASLIETFPGFPVGREWLICAITFGAGFFVIHAMAKWEAKGEEK